MATVHRGDFGLMTALCGRRIVTASPAKETAKLKTGPERRYAELPTVV
ncbi:hypothetical protein ACHZ98_33845 [Streptomyces sp. MAR4 CNY-716]